MLAIVLPYWRLVTFDGLVATDDVFTSDILSGEFPARVSVGAALRAGEFPTWTHAFCSGYPALAGGGGATDPITYAFFGLLRPLFAIDAFIVTLLLIAANGAFGFARRLGASTSGALLAGIAFAHSGYIVCQLKHLSIIGTVVWIPIALRLLDEGIASKPAHVEGEPTHRDRIASFACFGLVFGLQILAGFPQSAYIAGLAYGGWAVARASLLIVDRGRVQGGREAMARLTIALVTALLGVAMGAVQLLPMAELGSLSSRASGFTIEALLKKSYDPRAALSFFLPYANGDVSNATYRLSGVFWEEYGYVGLATILLAIFAGARALRSSASRESRRTSLILWAFAIVAFLMVLGPRSPLFRLAFAALPRLSTFRFPTRFLVLVDLALALLGGLGLTLLEGDVRARVKPMWRAWAPELLAGVVVAVTFGDLCWMQMRQNPMVAGQLWMVPPESALTLIWNEANLGRERIFTPLHRDMHGGAHEQAHGWSDLRPYIHLRDTIEPNTNALFDLRTVDCYAGISPAWYLAAWGDHNQPGMFTDRRVWNWKNGLAIHPRIHRVFQMFNVGWLLSPFPLPVEHFTSVNLDSDVQLYRVRDFLPRAYIVDGARRVESDRQAGDLILDDPTFDPTREVLLHDLDSVDPAIRARVAPTLAGAENPGRAAIVEESASRLRIEAHAARDGWLVLSDTIYPGWIAEVDGAPTPILRANVYVRAIPISAGNHVVTFRFESIPIRLGFRISLVAVWTLALLFIGARVRRG